ncbi:MAG TPA: hypothetical protein VMT57_05210 [Candidatus Thermoplasmatota archaeon]|nr:hypothetical protein [Candidatus Thermoplasmatota archaeon]
MWNSPNKKQFIVIGFIFLFLCVGFSGCDQQPDHNGPINDKFSAAIEIDLFAAAVRNGSYSGSAVFYTVAHSRIGENLTYEVDTGENVNYNGTIIRVVGHGTKSTHTYYTWNKYYTVTLTVRDNEGNINMTTRTIHIGAPPDKPLYIERNTNLPEMNDLTYSEVYSLYKITGA